MTTARGNARVNGRRGERGAAIVEFALVAPVLIMIMMGVVQVGLLLHQQQAIHASAREGARVGSVGTDEAGITTAVNGALTNINLATSPVITINPQNGSSIPCDETLNPRPDSVTVNVTVAAQLDIPFVAGQAVNLTGEGTFRCEYLG